MDIVGIMYNKVKLSVEKVCEPPDNWLKCNKQECVDARALLIHYLTRMGLSRSQISDRSGLTQQSIAYHIKTYEDKLSQGKLLRMRELEIDKEIEKE